MFNLCRVARNASSLTTAAKSVRYIIRAPKSPKKSLLAEEGVVSAQTRMSANSKRVAKNADGKCPISRSTHRPRRGTSVLEY